MKRARGPAAIVLGIMLLSALALTGCTAGAGAGFSSPNHGSTGQLAPQEAPPKGVASDSKALDTQTQNRSVVTTGSVSLTVDKPVAAATDAARIVATAGGRVDAMTEQPGTDTQRASATLTLRIPSATLQSTLNALKKLGTLNSVTTSAQDVTTQVKDVDARIAALQTSVDRLRELMGKATNTADLISIESALSERQATLDSLTAQQRVLRDQVSLATITLELHAEGTVAAAGPGDFLSGLVAGWNAMIVAGGAFLIFLGVALPWLVLLALIGGIAWGIIYLAGRGRRAKSQAPPAEG
jgi:hypothetical protein